MPISVVGYSLRFHTLTEAQVLASYAKLQKMGFDGVEGVSFRGWSEDEWFDKLNEYGLKTISIRADFDNLDATFKRAEKFGVKVFGGPQIGNNTMRSVDGFKAHAAELNKIAAPLKGTGYKIQYHNHAQEFRNFPEIGYKTGMQILIEETDPEVVAFEIDTHWVTAGGADPVEWVNKVAGRIPVIHFKDYGINYKEANVGLGYVSKTFAEIGNGNINWPPIVEAAKKAGVEWYSIEQDECPGDPYDSIKMSIDFMRGKLGIV